MTTLTKAVESINRAFNSKGYEYLINIMNNTLEFYDIKTIGIYGHIEEDGFYRLKAITAVGKDSPDHRHAEDLLLANIKRNDIENVHSFIMLSRIPCEKCMGNIFHKSWNKLTLMIPSKLNSKSKWFDTQVKALKYMNNILSGEVDFDEQTQRYKLVYIDD